MSYLEQLHTERTERLQRMRAQTVTTPIVPANLVRRPKPPPAKSTELASQAPSKPEPKPESRPYWFWMVLEPNRKHPPIKAIQRAVADHWSMEMNDLLSQRRTAKIIVPRHVAMYLAKKLTLKSLPDIGRNFAGRDHTTVLHAVRKVEYLIQKDAGLAQTVNEIELSLMGQQQ